MMKSSKKTRQASGKAEMRMTNASQVVSSVGKLHKKTSTKSAMKHTRYS